MNRILNDDPASYDRISSSQEGMDDYEETLLMDSEAVAVQKVSLVMRCDMMLVVHDVM